MRDVISFDLKRLVTNKVFWALSLLMVLSTFYTYLLNADQRYSTTNYGDIDLYRYNLVQEKRNLVSISDEAFRAHKQEAISYLEKITEAYDEYGNTKPFADLVYEYASFDKPEAHESSNSYGQYLTLMKLKELGVEKIIQFNNQLPALGFLADVNLIHNQPVSLGCAAALTLFIMLSVTNTRSRVFYDLSPLPYWKVICSKIVLSTVLSTVLIVASFIPLLIFMAINNGLGSFQYPIELTRNMQPFMSTTGSVVVQFIVITLVMSLFISSLASLFARFSDSMSGLLVLFIALIFIPGIPNIYNIPVVAQAAQISPFSYLLHSAYFYNLLPTTIDAQPVITLPFASALGYMLVLSVILLLLSIRLSQKVLKRY